MTLLLSVIACNGSINTGQDGDFALAFDGGGCVEVPVDVGARTEDLSIEAFVRGAVDADLGHKPIVIWRSVFALVDTDDGRTWFGEDDLDEGDGVFDVVGIMDGKSHHVAGTWASDGKMRLFVDGQLIGFQTSSPGTVIGDTIQIGCWTDLAAGFEGTLDEVRLSSSIRYEDTFEASFEPFEVDESTTALWHMDEGEGDTLVDATGNYDGVVYDTEWVAAGGSED
ncbi:MAG TPA: LamG-like jellyroll fold domain-containing protein [Myxococcota bacterium]|nr:LamG-like jellyroll fold domain-containing protein [Myxococcota bacterium]